MAIRKTASLENVQVLELRSSPTKIRHASLGKLADFQMYRTEDGYLYARIRAISSRVNKNHDGWPSIELAGGQDIFDRHHSSSDGFTVIADSGREFGFSTFLGKPIFVDHHNNDPDRARGVVVDAKLHVDDHKTASLDSYYSSPDVDPEHLPGTWIELLLEVDAKSFPKFAKAIVEGSRNPKKGIDGWSMGCFVAGTPITLSDGTQKPIEDIAVDDVVLTHTGQFEPVTATMVRHYTGTTYRVSTYGQSVPMTLTAEHPVWTEDGWTEAKDLHVGHQVLTPRIRATTGSPNAATARLVGYYAAEGNLGYDRNRYPDGRPVMVEWNFNATTEQHLVDQVVADLRDIGHQPAGPYLKNNCSTVRCNSPTLASWFLALAGRHSWSKKFAAEVLTWSEPAQRELLMSYFRGDANRLTERRVEAGTASRDLAHQVFAMATRVGFRMSPPVEQHSPSAIKAGKRPKHSMQGTLVAPHPGTVSNFHSEPEGLWRKITGIEVLDHNDLVYNFDVGGDDSYVAADIAVHNCDVERSVCSICKHAAASPEEYCQHIRMKGAHFDWVNPKTGHKTSRKAYENCYGVKFFEISGVFDPADATALSREVRSKTQEETITQNPKTKSLKDLADEQAEELLDEANRKRKTAITTPAPEVTDPAVLHGEAYHPELADQGIASGQLYNGPQGVDSRLICDACGAPIRNMDIMNLLNPHEKEDFLQRYRTAGRLLCDHCRHLGSQHLAANPLPQSELSHAPEHVDTLREEEICPVCGSSMDEDTCDVCGYQEPPEGFDNPDLTKVEDRETPTEPMDDVRLDSPGVDATETAPPVPEATNTPMNPALVAHVTSDMDWTVHSKTSARINKNERPLVTVDKPQTNEPKEQIISDQLRPVTSTVRRPRTNVRTAEDFIAAAGATRRNMNHTADAASGAPAVAKPDVKTDVQGVGGVDQASNEAASKADAQVEVTAIGGTGVESVAADQEGVNVEQGDEHSKNVESIPTKTWSGEGPGNGDSLGQHDPVTGDTPWYQDNGSGWRGSSWRVEGYDDGAFPADAGIGGGTAVQGVQPIAEQFGERVNVLEHVTSPANNSGATKTWTGTDGNGVLKQQDPVTNESIARGESGIEGAPNWTSSTHIFAAFKLADLEVDLGLLAADRKYVRVAELEAESPQVVEASLKYAQRVKSAGARKTAGVQKLPVMGRSAEIEKGAAVTTADDSFMFGGV